MQRLLHPHYPPTTEVAPTAPPDAPLSPSESTPRQPITTTDTATATVAGSGSEGISLPIALEVAVAAPPAAPEAMAAAISTEVAEAPEYPTEAYDSQAEDSGAC